MNSPVASGTALCLSTSSPSSKSAAFDQDMEGRSDPDSSSVAQTAVVSRNTQNVSIPQMDLANLPRSSVSRASVAPQAPDVPLCSLEVEWQALRLFGYSEEVVSTLLVSRKESTKRVYNRMWTRFAY